MKIRIRRFRNWLLNFLISSAQEHIEQFDGSKWVNADLKLSQSRSAFAVIKKQQPINNLMCHNPRYFSSFFLTLGHNDSRASC